MADLAPRGVALVTHRASHPLRDLTGIGRYLVGLTAGLHAGTAVRPLVVAPPESRAAVDWSPVPVVRVGQSRTALLLRWAVTGRPVVERLLADVDLVHVISPAVPVPTRRPAVWTLHDTFPLDQPEWSSARARWLFRRCLPGLRGAAAVIVPSRVVADRALELGIPAPRVHVVPEAADDRFHGAMPSPDRLPAGVTPGSYWLLLGTAAPRKNWRVVIAALAATPPPERRPVLLVGPPSRHDADLMAHARDCGVAAEVHRLGFVPDDDLPGLVAGARALLHPSLGEGFGLPVIEAMAAGTPVAVAAAAALPETVGAAGLLVDPTDPGAWAAAMAVLAEDDAHAELVGRARPRGAEHRWDAVAIQTAEVYATCR